MNEIFELVGPERSVRLFGIRLVAVNAENGKKLLLTIAFIILVSLLAKLGRLAVRALHRVTPSERVGFWARQAVNLFSAALLVLGVLSIWFDDPTRLTTALGLVTAGLAFALQRVVTALAGYVIILRGGAFGVGDRITMGGVRGDVIRLDFTQTTIMEMGQPPSIENAADPAMWVRSRQYTGRIVTVTNDKVFTEPIYNYTREFPYIWEEMRLPIKYGADRARAEQILLEAAREHTVRAATLSEEILREFERRYALSRSTAEPQVYYRLTDNWLELTVRFITTAHHVREMKDALGRAILQQFEAAHIPIASATFEVVGLPTIEIATRRTAR